MVLFEMHLRDWTKFAVLKIPNISLQNDFKQFVLPISIKPNETADLTLVHEELIKRSFDRYRHTLSISPGEKVPDFQARIHREY